MAQLLKLDGAEDLRQQVLKNYDFKVKRKSGGYQGEFCCPVCHKCVVHEDFKETRDEWFGRCWLISWSSECGHLNGQVTYSAEPREIPVQEGGKIVAAIVPHYRLRGALWHRLDWKPISDKSRIVRFGTVGQALKVNVYESQLFGVMQAGDKRYD